MLQLLRAVYPQGCLITEIVSIESGNYLVRVSVQVEGVTIVTGFAASNNLEVAQDKALARVLKILGIKVEPELSPSLSFESKENGHNLGIENPIIAELTTLEDSFSSDSGVSPTPVTNLTATDVLSEKPIEELSLPKVAIAAPIMAESGSLEAPKPPIEPLQSSLPAPTIDKSELNNQIAIEMERLSWTRQKGRDYLTTKYGENKKTRRDLSDAELLEFCTYLQSLP
jgi:hypothetical protein